METISSLWELAREYNLKAVSAQQRARLRGDFKEWQRREFCPQSENDIYLKEFNEFMDNVAILAILFDT